MIEERLKAEVEDALAKMPPDMAEVSRRLWNRKKEEGPLMEETPKQQARVIRLDFWENDKRGGPNSLFRSALFPALNKQTRRFLKHEHLFAVRGLEVVFTGEQFDQSDLDVYLEILNLARKSPLGTPVRFSAHSMLKTLGRPTGGSHHKWLHSVLIRLRGGTLDITDHMKRYFGGLIEGGIKDETMESYEITINPKFAVLFGVGMWSKIDLQQRQALGRNPTAKALHAYYSTHTSPHGHDIKTLADIAGLKDKNPRKLKMKIVAAHDLLTSPEGLLSSYKLVGDIVRIKKNHSKSQMHHLVKKVATKPKKTRHSGNGSTS
ncbi:MAG: plasmid replication initiator TrfA [Deltaproteobacteria bacterium]|jgi:hypothetical protein|nr:plasmid replication initiator TrfA [Deltaproteobacteria bacterium]